jgi:outer membrane receptor protein involved in Fe transport
MVKRALLVIIGFLGFCLPLAAQDETITRDDLQQTGALDTASALIIHRPDIFSAGRTSLLIHGLPSLTLLDGRRFLSASALGRMGMMPLDLFPVAFISAVDVEKVNGSPMYGTDSPGGIVNVHLNRYDSGGEMGLFYGYIIGGVGDERFQITVGAAYQESRGYIQRPTSFTPPN